MTEEHSRTIVSVVQLESYDPEKVDEALKALLKPLGGPEAYFQAAQPALLKPNLLAPRSPDDAVCTHPEIIRAVGRMARGAGVRRVEVTDSPGFGTAHKNLGKMGIGPDEGLHIKEADDGYDVHPPEGAALKVHRLQLSRRIVETDCVINLPKAKTHGQMVITGAVKNMYGAVVGMEKVQWHYRAGRDAAQFAQLVVHVQEMTKPRLHILDAVVGMEGNGPGSGERRTLGLLLASTNPYALDSVLARIFGLEPAQVHVLNEADKLGLLPRESELKIEGPPIEELVASPPWAMARPVAPTFILKHPLLVKMLDRLLRVKPKTNQKKCTACGRCQPACAAEAISIDPMRRHRGQAMVIDYDACISCFCCQEMCPEGAISVQAGPLARLLKLGVRTES